MKKFVNLSIFLIYFFVPQNSLRNSLSNNLKARVIRVNSIAFSSPRPIAKKFCFRRVSSAQSSENIDHKIWGNSRFRGYLWNHFRNHVIHDVLLVVLTLICSIFCDWRGDCDKNLWLGRQILEHFYQSYVVGEELALIPFTLFYVVSAKHNDHYIW